MATPVRDENPAAAPEELVLGPRPRRPVPRWLPLLALSLGIMLVAVASVWRFWPQPVEPLTLADLQDTYAGMVRSDGTNDASVLTRQSVAEMPLSVRPAECQLLVEATMANRFPDAALDGVGTYWVGTDSAISLFTLRFPDESSVAAYRDQLASTLDRCIDRRIRLVSTREPASSGWEATVSRTVAGSSDQLGYLLGSSDSKQTVQLMPYLNTITWQSRYETGSANYSPLAADQLMQSLHSQLDAVVEARPG